MSGIAGILNLDGSPVDSGILHAMTEIVAHRGPDGIAYKIDGPVGLAQLQLYTTPESLREAQPWVSPCGNYVITCDGRVDNRHELVSELRSNAPVSPASTDVEIILHGYIKWGPSVLKRLVGDFAFAIWDRQRRRLFCARDPVGVRGFHYYYDGSRFVFGTDVRQVLAHPAAPRDLNQLMVGLHLASAPSDGQMTFYQAVRRLQGGTSLTVSTDGLALDTYWRPRVGEQLQMRDDEYPEQFLSLFKKAVAARMRSHRPVAISLSGGMDSSSIACVAETMRLERPGEFPELHAYSYAFHKDQEPDPPEHIKAMQAMYGFPLTWIDAHDLYALRDFEKQEAPDEPIVPQYEAHFRRTFDLLRSQGIRTILNGYGGDELLGVRAIAHLRDLLRGFRLNALGRDLAPLRFRLKLRAPGLLLPAMLPTWLRSARHRTRLNIPPWIRTDFRDRSGLSQWIRDRTHAPAYPNAHARAFESILEQRMPTALLSYNRISSQYSVEGLHSYWDVRIVDFLLRVPPEQKWSRGVTKRIVRSAMAGIVPEPILQRRVRSNFPALRPRRTASRTSRGDPAASRAAGPGGAWDYRRSCSSADLRPICPGSRR